jgi:hypothetical protein
VLNALGDDIHLPGRHMNGAVTEINPQIPVNDTHFSMFAKVL